MSELHFFDRLEKACSPGRSRVIALAAGETLFRQGDDPPGLLQLAEGQVDLVRWTRAGRAVRIHVARAGETFAEASLYADRCHCDAVAAASSIVRLLPQRYVLRAFEEAPALAQAFAVYLAGSLMNARRLLELRAITPLTERARVRLEELADAEGGLPAGTTLVSIAADLDVTPPALYRAVAALEADGVLSRPARGRLRMLSPQSS